MTANASRLIDLDDLTQRVEQALERRNWTLSDLTHELYIAGYPTSHNKLWRLMNKKVSRIDSELLLWLESVLQVRLLPSLPGEVAADEVLDLIRSVGAALREREPLPEPGNPDLLRIRNALLATLRPNR